MDDTRQLVADFVTTLPHFKKTGTPYVLSGEKVVCGPEIAQQQRAFQRHADKICTTFFQEFVVQCPLSPKEVIARLLNDGIIGGLDVSDRVPNGMLLCVTEMNTRQDIDRLRDALAEAGR